MSTLLEPETETASGQHDAQTNAAANQLRHDFAALRLKFKWLGTTRTLSSEQKSQAAESFGADGRSIQAGKKLFDTRHAAYKSLTALRTEITSWWKGRSLPYPESGIRLIRHTSIGEFNNSLSEFRRQLDAGVQVLDDEFAELKAAARHRLGTLFDASDYPVSLVDEFDLSWDFPSVEPPDYLRRLNPEVYAQQADRISQRFDRAVEMAETAFTEELERLVHHLTERLSGDDDGKPRIFRDSAVTNLSGFFQRFRELSIRSNEQLDELVDRCEDLLGGVAPQTLRSNDSLRQSLAENLSSVQQSLDQLMIDRPRRNIARPNRSNRLASESQ